MKNRWFSGLFNRRADREEGGSVSVERALEIFDYLADSPDLPFNHPYGGCYEKAHMMCRIMMDMGLAPKKAWAFMHDHTNLLHAEMPDGKKLSWKQHVAAVLPVQMKDGAIEELVLDPALFDGPVPLKVWGDAIHAQPQHLEITSVTVPPKEGFAGQDYATRVLTQEADLEAMESLSHYSQHQSAAPRIVFPSETRQEVRAPLQGRTWLSLAAMKHSAAHAPGMGQ